MRGRWEEMGGGSVGGGGWEEGGRGRWKDSGRRKCENEVRRSERR